jgi:hypothetical protein
LTGEFRKEDEAVKMGDEMTGKELDFFQ